MLILAYISIFWIGVIFGNLATTFFFRIPRGIPLNGLERPPMCSYCGVRLYYPTYVPFYQILFGGGKCKNCHAKIPIIYSGIELLTGICAALFFYFASFNFMSVLQFLIVLVMSIKSLIFFHSQKIYEKLNWMLLSLTLLLTFFVYPKTETWLDYLLQSIVVGILCLMIFKRLYKEVEIEDIMLILIISMLVKKLLFVFIFAIILFFYKYKNFKKYTFFLVTICIFLSFLLGNL